MIRAIIIDEDRNGQNRLKQLCKAFRKEIEIVATLDAILKGVEAIKKTEPDLVFLNVEMSLHNGFKLFDYFDSEEFYTVFTSVFEEHAIKAIKFSAIDYLLKPILLEDFKNTIKRVVDRKELDKVEGELLNSQKSLSNVCNKLVLPTMEGYYFIELQNIIRCESQSNYTFFYMINGDKILVSKTLKVFNEILKDKNFFRISRSDLINLNHIERFGRQKNPVLTLSDSTVLNVSLRRVDSFLKAIDRL